MTEVDALKLIADRLDTIGYLLLFILIVMVLK